MYVYHPELEVGNQSPGRWLHFSMEIEQMCTHWPRDIQCVNVDPLCRLLDDNLARALFAWIPPRDCLSPAAQFSETERKNDWWCFDTTTTMMMKMMRLSDSTLRFNRHRLVSDPCRVLLRKLFELFLQMCSDSTGNVQRPAAASATGETASVPHHH